VAVAIHAGVLALQGAFQAHAAVLRRIGCLVREVRQPGDLAGLQALCMPGGESTVMSLLLDSSGLREPLRHALTASEAGGQGLPVLATCAGMILLARELSGDTGSRKVEGLGLLDARINRNGYGRQLDSFEAELRIDWQALRGRSQSNADEISAFPGVFIRAPRIESLGSLAQAAGWCDSEPVLLRQGNIIATSFHPELSGDDRLHRALLLLALCD
jgi:5'-phosphate synthase pdxT subunit